MKRTLLSNKRYIITVGLTLTAGVLLGWLLFRGPMDATVPHGEAAGPAAKDEKTVWTCSMHPQIRTTQPGQCPICAMDLIPLQEDGALESTNSPDEIRMTASAMKIADIQTITVQKAFPNKTISLLGKVKPDETSIAELTARFGGRIEKLYVNFTGQNVGKGEKLATIYSPALMTAQKELIEARAGDNNPALYKAARNKLKLWDLTDDQIDAIAEQGEANTFFDILSPITGTVMQRNVSHGDYVKEGSTLFQVIDLKRVWVMFEAYESDLSWVKTGDKVEFTIPSLPGKSFSGRVAFIDPLIDPATRIAQVRVEIGNPGHLLKPEMFANGVVTSKIAGNKKELLIPKTAALWTGKRAVVYVKLPGRGQPTFTYREIVLGPSAGEFYVVHSGLAEGEEIAVNGV
ncbi:MAG: efflux RND transporter periplasmic adaptor subunit, partial [Chitinispirillaceae bacterium]|nr:efflux RND transporter periplasmic adaptor subunit [Chitinispirillaceae bacterium]